ncbi:MAG TPA: four-carbon acid sugar kinase family protein, partial [Clostridia bacterium]
MSGKAGFQSGACMPLRTFLADDLTGAMDTGVQVAGQTGNPVFCLWHPEKIAALPPDATIVVDTESRNLPAAEAIAAIRTTMDALLSVNRTVDYKKIDSTMRGHVAEELAEILRLNPRRGALICPALPAQGRSVNHGTLYVDGIPLSETDLAHDPLFSLSSSYLPDLLASLGAVSLLPDEACRIPGLLAQGIQVFTADAATISDLEMWAMAASSYDLLPVGSAGLASAWT